MPHATASAVNVPTTAETLVAFIPVQPIGTTPNVPALPTSILSHVWGKINMLFGAAATAINIRLRAGNGVTGAVLANDLVTVTAAATDSIPYDFYDDAAAGVGGYSLTVQQTAATGAGTVNSATMTQDVL